QRLPRTFLRAEEVPRADELRPVPQDRHQHEKHGDQSPRAGVAAPQIERIEAEERPRLRPDERCGEDQDERGAEGAAEVALASAAATRTRNGSAALARATACHCVARRSTASALPSVLSTARFSPRSRLRGNPRFEAAQAERHQAQGLTIPQSCKRLGISEAGPVRFRGNRWRAGASVCRCAYRTSTYMTSTALLP